MMSLRFYTALIGVIILCVSPSGHAENYLQRGDVRSYISEVSEEHGLDKNYLAGLFVKLSKDQNIIDAISRPAERTLTWREYRPIFITDRRIKEGREFIQEHRSLLQRASSVYGVPPNIIAAIIGVETYYGRITGKNGVLSSLATLAFDYPPRASFFKRELTEFLVLSSAEGWDTSNVLGSYAGAMGVPQFISSSYREYAVDFDGDGKRDLFNSLSDVVGSVANYLSVHGWVEGAPIAEAWKEPTVGNGKLNSMVRSSLKPVHNAGAIKQMGFRSASLDGGTRNGKLLSVMSMQGRAGEEFWVGYQNFYVITRYNHSRMYALAVFQLAEAFNSSVQ